jgi:hypothetical protein
VTAFQPEAVRLGGDYEVARDDARRRLAQAKEARRIHLDDRLSLVFENGPTVQAAAEESLRSERVTGADAAREHLEAFGSVAPAPGTLAAVLFLDSDDPAALAETAAALRGVQRSVALEIDGERVRALPSGLDDEAAAHHLTFALPDDLRRQLAGGAAGVSVVIEHPGAQIRVALNAEQRRALVEDL